MTENTSFHSRFTVHSLPLRLHQVLQWHHPFSGRRMLMCVCISRRQCVWSRSIRLLLSFLKTENRMRQSRTFSPSPNLPIQYKQQTVTSDVQKHTDTHTRARLLARRVNVNGELAASLVCRWSVSLFFTCVVCTHFDRSLNSSGAPAVPSRRNTYNVQWPCAQQHFSLERRQEQTPFNFSLCQKLFISPSLSFQIPTSVVCIC